MSARHLSTQTVRPWKLLPRFDVALTSPVKGSEWTWRELAPAHPAIREQPAFLRRSDAEDAVWLISERYGDPTAYCVLGANLACVMGWRDLEYDVQYDAITHAAGAFPCGGMYYLSVTGPDAGRALDLLTPRSIGALDVGQATFVIFTTPEGTVETEGIVLRDGLESFKASIGGDTRPPAWLFEAVAEFPAAHAAEANVTSFNLKGPQRDQALQRLLTDEFEAAVPSLPTFRAIPVRTRWGADAWALRTVVGLELWATPAVIREAWRRMVADPKHVTPCGWEVLASYRLECSDISFYLCPLDLHRATYLHDAGLEHVISEGKQTPYVGRAALEQPDRYGGGLQIAGLVAGSASAPRRAVGEPLRIGPGPVCGFVTTAGWSPVAAREMCFAHLTTQIKPGAMVRFADGTDWQVVPLPILPKLTGDCLR